MSDRCPNCGYPDTFDGKRYKGVYIPGKQCDNCRFGATLPREILDEMVLEKLGTLEGTHKMFLLLLQSLELHGPSVLKWPLIKFLRAQLELKVEEANQCRTTQREPNDSKSD